MIILFNLPGKQIELEIDLVKNTAVDAWVDFFCKNQTIVAKSHMRDHASRNPYDPGKVRYLFEQCTNLVAALHKENIIYTGPWPMASEYITQDWCNHAHRFFTHQQKIINQINEFEYKPVEQDFVRDRKFYITENLLTKLNTAIHDIEDHLEPLYTFDFDIKEILVYTNWQGNATWLEFTEAHRKFHSKDHYDIILSDQILGKSILGSYLNNDNPSDWDTSGHHCANGSLFVQTSDFRQKIYNLPHFKRWLANHSNLTPWYDFPIGNVVNRDKLKELSDYLNENDTVIQTSYRI